ncbi:MAG: hypothetical protein AAGH92_13175, partial [Planctomycetota bacterium]
KRGGRSAFGADIDAAGRFWVVRSNDTGKTWQQILELEQRVDDIAVDAERDRVYITSGGVLWVWQNGALQSLDTPVDQFGKRQVHGVAVDPVDSNVVYAAQRKNIYAVSVSAMRSRDAGRTWEALSRQQPLASGDRDGGRESFGVRVHPETRKPWFVTGCHGIWKHAAP